MVPTEILHGQTVDVLDIVNRYLPLVELKKRGKLLVVLCPFHEEKTPSFTVSREKQTFRCFGCGVHGDTIQLVVLALGVRPVEAARTICRDFGLSVVGGPVTPEDRRKALEVVRERARAKEATEFFNHLIEETHDRLCAYYRAINRILDRFGPFFWPELIHTLSVIEHYLDCLEFGDTETKLNVLEEIFK